MLGEQIGEITGIVNGQKVLDVEEDCHKIEVSISGSGKFKGINVTEMWTYFSLHRNDGLIYGEGKGVITATNGNEYATATGRSSRQTYQNWNIGMLGLISIGQVHLKASYPFLRTSL